MFIEFDLSSKMETTLSCSSIWTGIRTWMLHFSNPFACGQYWGPGQLIAVKDESSVFTCASIDLARPVPFEKLREMAPVLDDALDAYAASRVESYYSEISLPERQIVIAGGSDVGKKIARSTSSQETTRNQETVEKVSAVFAEAITAVKTRGNSNEPTTA